MSAIPVLGICAQASGMGKTTLLAGVLPVLAARGLRVSVIKQARADFDVDHPGKDSHRLRAAGAAQVLLSSEQRWVLMSEQPAESADTRLLAMLERLDPALADLVLVEGFREAPIPKIEVFRPVCGKPLRAPHDGHIIAVASDMPVATARPVLDLNSAAAVADFILVWWGRQQAAVAGALAG